MIVNNIQVRMALQGAEISFFTKDKEQVNKLLMESNKAPLNLNFEPLRKRRSKDANAYMWQLCNQIAEAIQSTKEDVYKEAIRQVGNFKDIALVDEAVETMLDVWQSRGIGWFADTFDSKLEGCKRLRLYIGSHVYNSKEMAILIDYIVNEAKELGIETLTPDEIKKLKGIGYDDIQSRKNKELYSDEQLSLQRKKHVVKG